MTSQGIPEAVVERELALAYKAGWDQAHFERNSGKQKPSIIAEQQAQRRAAVRMVKIRESQ